MRAFTSQRQLRSTRFYSNLVSLGSIRFPGCKLIGFMCQMSSLFGADIARMECVCTEMSNNDLWKRKFEEEFGGMSGAGALPMWIWRSMFRSYWLAQKKHDLAITRRQGQRYIPIWRDPNPMHPFGQPHIIGGDFDTFPFGLSHMFGSPYLPTWFLILLLPILINIQSIDLEWPPCNHGAGQNYAQ